MGLSQDNILRKLFRIVSYSLELLLVRLYNKSFLGSNDIAAQFHSLYYSSPERTWNNTRWMGYRTMPLSGPMPPEVFRQRNEASQCGDR